MSAWERGGGAGSNMHDLRLGTVSSIIDVSTLELSDEDIQTTVLEQTPTAGVQPFLT